MDILEAYMDQTLNEFGGSNIINEDCILIQEGAYYDILQERARFSFALKFSEDPQTRNLWKAAKEAEDFLNDKGELTQSDVAKGWGIAFKVLRIIYEIDTSFTLVYGAYWVPAAAAISPPLAIGGLIGIIVGYLITRLINWALRHGENAMAESNAKKARAQLIQIKGKMKTKEDKEKVDKLIEKLEKKIKDSEDY